MSVSSHYGRVSAGIGANSQIDEQKVLQNGKIFNDY